MNYINTKSDVAAIARKFKLVGRSKIETKEQLLKALKAQGFSEQRKLLMSVCRRFKNLHTKYQVEIDQLPEPAKPLKGHGYDRQTYFSTEVFNSFRVPSIHTVEISSRRQRGHFSWSTAISPELSLLLVKFENVRDRITSEFELLESPILKATKTERPETRKVDSTDCVLTAFFKAEQHPAPEAVCSARLASGLSWREARLKFS